MPSARSLIALCACSSLLAVQLGGIHMHVDDHGYIGTPEGMHLHAQQDGPHGHDHGDARRDQSPLTGSDDHDFDGATDISLIELGGIASKLLLALVLLAFGRVLIGPRSASIVVGASRPSPGRRQRWRPPLRAPPLAA